MTAYYDRDGDPIDRAEWLRAYSGENFRVAADEVDGIPVSTIWLGVDHRHGEGPPLIFETMILGGPHKGTQWRYSTEEEALAGHARAVEKAKSA